MIELKRRAQQRTRELLSLASRRLGTSIPDPSIRFDLKGTSAGQVRTLDGLAYRIRYNSLLLERNPQDFLAATVPHEAAHLVAFHLFGPKVRPHGREWRAIMRLFDAEPRRCHNYDLEGLVTRRLRRYGYRCGCRYHSLTSIRHNRIRAGRTYLCRRCGHALEPIPEIRDGGGT